MSADVVALVAGTLLGVGALGFVLYPLFFTVRDADPRGGAPRRPADDSAIVALREIEFDRATGKLSDRDYTEMRALYGARALREMRGDVRAPDDASAKPLGAEHAGARGGQPAHRECPTCGVRPEADALYCSTCGTYLDAACPSCKTDIREAGAAFCSTCGAALAAPAADLVSAPRFRGAAALP